MSGKSPSSPPIAVRCCQITGFCLASRVRRVLMPLISCNCLACRVRAHICKQSTGAGSDQSTAMARSALKIVVLLAAALLAVPQAEASKKGLIGKGLIGKGKGGDVNVDVQCQDVCNDVCVPVPNKVCSEVPFQTQVCQKVPVQQTKQHCERVCTQTYTQTMSTGKGAVAVMPVHAGKGKGIGRHLLHKKSLIKGHMLKGKGATGALVDSNCQDVCKDVPYTTFTTECEQVTRTRTQCETVFEQSCRKVCKPHCQKITTVTTTQTMSTGKGMPVIIKGKGKGL